MQIDQLTFNPTGKRILVIGDIMLDHTINYHKIKDSPENGVPVTVRESETFSLGGAANVAANCRAMGAEVTLFGAMGLHQYAGKTRQMIRDLGITLKCGWHPSAKMTVKHRINIDGQPLMRVDNDMNPVVKQDILWYKLLELNPQKFNVVIISDYAKGVVLPEFCRQVITKCNELQIPVIVDPKGTDWSKYKGATVITPNLKEFNALVPTGHLWTVESLSQRCNCIIVLTLGSKGVSVGSGTYGEHYNAIPIKAIDSCGAGDTFIAVLACAQDNHFMDAVYIANIAGAISVTKPGTAVVTMKEINDKIKELQLSQL